MVCVMLLVGCGSTGRVPAPATGSPPATITAWATPGAAAPPTVASPSRPVVTHGPVLYAGVTFTLVMQSTARPTVDLYQLRLAGTAVGQTSFALCGPGARPCVTGGTFPLSFSALGAGIGHWEVQHLDGPDGRRVTVIAKGTFDLSNDSVTVTA
jgi:hypothetical protein